MAQVGQLDSTLPGSTDVVPSTDVQPCKELETDSQQNNMESQNSNNSTTEAQTSESIQQETPVQDQLPKMAQVGHLDSTLPGSADVIPSTDVQPCPELETDSQQNNMESQNSNDSTTEAPTSESIQQETPVQDQLSKVGHLDFTQPGSVDVVPSTDVHPELKMDSKKNNVDSQNSSDSAAEPQTSENGQQGTFLQETLPNIPEFDISNVTKIGIPTIPSIPEIPSLGDKLTSLPVVGKIPKFGINNVTKIGIPTIPSIPEIPSLGDKLTSLPVVGKVFVALGFQSAATKNKQRKWNTSLTDCLVDKKTCLAVMFLPICHSMFLSQRAGESCLLPVVFPAGTWLVALRTKIRTKYNIEGSIMDDCYTVTAKAPFVECQLARELDYVDSLGETVQMPTDQEIEHM